MKKIKEISSWKIVEFQRMPVTNSVTFTVLVSKRTKGAIQRQGKRWLCWVKPSEHALPWSAYKPTFQEAKQQVIQWVNTRPM